MQLEEVVPQAQTIGVSDLPIEKREVVWPPLTPEDLTALKMVVQDARNTEFWLTSSGWRTRWEDYDRLYLFQVPVAYWEGTAVERAHLGVPLVYEHVGSILPQVMTGLFQDDPPFMSRPRPGTSMDAARANDVVLGWELKQSKFREELRRGAKNALLYGTGLWKYGWRSFTRERMEYRIKKRRVEQDTPTGKLIEYIDTDEFEQVPVREEVNEPTFESLDLRSVLVDPSLRVPDIRFAKFVIHKLYVTATQLDELREQPGYKIPTREQLVKIFMPPKEAAVASPLAGSPLDVNTDFGTPATATLAESPHVETTIDPLSEPLEVLEYWTNNRVTTVLQRKLVIRNAPNELGEIPFRSLAYDDIPNCFYGLGVAKLVGGEQRLQQGSINAYLDDLSLSLNGMFVRIRGSNVPRSQIRMRPGGVLDVDVENGIGLLQRPALPTADVMAVVAASDARAQRRTAANELVVQGAMPGAGNRSSVTRTATGVQFLAGGVGTRLQFFIENLAAQVFIPTLEAYRRMNAKKLSPSQVKRLLSAELNKAYEGSVLDVVNAELDFDILAAAKLQARRAMAMSLPILLQTLLTEPVINGLRAEGKKVNVGELIKMLFDVSGWPNKQDVIVEFNADDELREVANNPMIQQLLQSRAQAETQRDLTNEKIEHEGMGRMSRDIVKAALKGVSEEGKEARTPLER